MHLTTFLIFLVSLVLESELVSTSDNLDRRQVQPAAVGAPAQVAAGAAPNALPKNPVAPVANPITPSVATTPATPLVATTPIAAPANPAIPAPAGGNLIGGIPVTQGPAIAVASAPPPKSGSIGLGTLTGKIGVVKTQEAKSEAGLAAGNTFGFIASWPSAFKVGASLLLGTAVGVGILL
ncbi:MAG: hypothetical protein Q9226_006883 [Calogaya cf. arnoldii]